MRKNNMNENIIIGYIITNEYNTRERIINSYKNVKSENPGIKFDIIDSIQNEKEFKKCW